MKGFSMVLGLLLSSMSLSAQAANEQRCLEDLDRLVGSSITLIEDNPSDGCPLSLTISNFNPDLARLRASVSTVARKGCGNNWQLVESMGTGRNRAITNCSGQEGSLRFTVMGQSIRQSGGTWMKGSQVFNISR